MAEPTQDELESACCLERDDTVPGRPAMSAFRRSARLHQARWRELHGHPMGTQPIRPVPPRPSRPVGSRMRLAYAIETGANLVTPAAFQAVRRRLAIVEPHQSIDQQRLWADLTWSSPVAFNLFGEVATDLDSADRVVRSWFPDAPGRVSAVRFLHSPGRFDPAYLDSLRDFLVAFELDLGDGTHGMIAVDVKFFEVPKAEQPKPTNVAGYRAVADASAAFVPGSTDRLAQRTVHCVTWLEHLLLLSMLQHKSGSWIWGRYLVVHHPDNVDVAEMLDGYRAFLADTTTFHTLRLDDLVESGVLPAATTDAVRRRYIGPSRRHVDATTPFPVADTASHRCSG
ncbi:MAG: hypothetical protein ABIO83_10800 [Ilumatobacteraceae bacterium]